MTTRNNPGGEKKWKNWAQHKLQRPSVQNWKQRSTQIIRLTDSAYKHTEGAVSRTFIRNLVLYAKSLAEDEGIEINVFQAQMSKYFDLIGSNVDQMFKLFAITKAAGESFSKKNERISVLDYVKILSTFYSGKTNLIADLVFRVFDSNGDGYIDYYDIRQYMGEATKCFSELYDLDEAEIAKNDLVEMVFGLFPKSSSSISSERKISFEEFQDLLHSDDAYTEVFGQIIPRKRKLDEFYAMLDGKIEIQIESLFRNERNDCFNGFNPPSIQERMYPVPLVFSHEL